MKNVIKASINDLDAILHIDIDVIGNDSRRDYIKETINEGRCIIVKEDNSISVF